MICANLPDPLRRYWGIIEMQARLTANRWLTQQTPAQRHFEESEKLLELRGRMQNRALDVPQYCKISFRRFINHRYAAYS